MADDQKIMNTEDIETIVKTIAKDIRENGGVLADSTQSVLVKCIAAGICALFAFVFYVNSQIVGINSKLEGGIMTESQYKIMEVPQQMKVDENTRLLSIRATWIEETNDRLNKLERAYENE